MHLYFPFIFLDFFKGVPRVRGYRRDKIVFVQTLLRLCFDSGSTLVRLCSRSPRA